MYIHVIYSMIQCVVRSKNIHTNAYGTLIARVNIIFKFCSLRRLYCRFQVLITVNVQARALCRTPTCLQARRTVTMSFILTPGYSLTTEDYNGTWCAVDIYCNKPSMTPITSWTRTCIGFLKLYVCETKKKSAVWLCRWFSRMGFLFTTV